MTPFTEETEMRQRKHGLARRIGAGCAALACLVAGSAMAAPEIHRWVDENGVVHFSDVKPAAAPSTTLEIDAGPRPPDAPSPVASAEAPAADAEPVLSAAEQRRQAIRERRAEQAAERAEAERWCDRHRTRLEQMEPARRVFFTDENGEQVRMDDDRRMGLIEESKTYLAENCQ
jgi:hypothetical protein